MKKLYLIAAMLILTGVASANFSAENTAQDFTIDTAGGNYTDNISVKWTGDYPVVVDTEASVEADSTNSKGLNVSYTPERFIIDSGETREISFVVSTSPALIPDSFSITHKIGTEIPLRVEERTHTRVEERTVYITRNVSENSTENVTVIERGDLNASEEEDLRERLQNYSVSLEEQNDLIEGLREDIEKAESERDNLRSQVEGDGELVVPLLVGFAIILLVVVLLYLSPDKG